MLDRRLERNDFHCLFYKKQYRRYLFCLFDELAVDLGVLFDDMRGDVPGLRKASW